MDPCNPSWSSCRSCESDRKHSIRSDVPPSIVSARHVRRQHTAHLVSRARYEIATSSRICGGKAQTRRVNVNVLTRLPKIRAVPAPIRPLNSTPVYWPHQAQSSVHLWTVGCWGFDVGEGSNGIKDPILCPFFSPLFPIPGSSIWLIMQQKCPFSLLFAPANKQRLHVFC